MNRLGETGGERYGLALVLILASMVFIMAAPQGNWTWVVTLLFQGGALVAALRAAGAANWVRFSAFALIVASLAIALADAVSSGESGSVLVRCANLMLIVIAPPVIGRGIVRQIKENRAVTVHTMMGALCIYLLIALTFATVFGVEAAITGDSFFRDGAGGNQLSDYLYFSLTTVTTLGIGDFVPASSFGRSMTASEAIIGQIYVVTVIAVIVGNLGRHR